jgi:hypothetical protein
VPGMVIIRRYWPRLCRARCALLARRSRARLASFHHNGVSVTGYAASSALTKSVSVLTFDPGP